MQAIQTKYIPATNTKPSRIKAWCEAGSVTVSYSYDDDEYAMHKQAAETLRDKLGWTTKYYGDLIGGGLPGNSGYAFIFTGVQK